MNSKALFIPVILGTTRKGRASENVAKFVYGEVQKRTEVESELIDICELAFATDDAGEAIKLARFSEIVERADGLILVVPEYNHGYPGLLKHVLDSNLKEYIQRRSAAFRLKLWRRAHRICCRCSGNWVW
jgi:NAD(P)H-dependent FMN reductase